MKKGLLIILLGLSILIAVQVAAHQS